METNVQTQGLVGAENHQGSAETLPIISSEVSLAAANKRAVKITKPVLHSSTQQQQATQITLSAKKQGSSKATKAAGATATPTPKKQQLASSPQGKIKRNDNVNRHTLHNGSMTNESGSQQKSQQHKNGHAPQQPAGPPQKGAKFETSVTRDNKQNQEASRHAKNGVVSTQAGIKVKKLPPPLPKNFQQSPLYDQNTAAQFYRLQQQQEKPGSNLGDTQKELFNKTIKIASESSLGNQSKNKKQTLQQSPVVLKNQLLKEHMVSQNQTSARTLQALPDAISMKAVAKNTDMYAGFEIVTVSDAFASVELKKVSREIQKEKRRLREERFAQNRNLLNQNSTNENLNLPEKRPSVLNLGMMSLSEAIVEASESKSPLSKAMTKNYDKPTRSKPPPALRKTSTMVKSPGRTHKSSKLVTGRQQHQAIVTEKEQSANDYGFMSPPTTNKVHNKAVFQIGQRSIEVSGQDNDEKQVVRQGSPDSGSYSLNSINSIDENTREALKKSLKNYESQSSTLDLGQSMSRSKLSVHNIRGATLNKIGIERNSTQSPGRKLYNKNPAIGRQRTFKSTSMSPSDRQINSNANKRPHVTQDLKKNNELSNASLGVGGIGARDADQRSNQSHYGGTLSQKPVGEDRDQRIFDIYMKAPYHLMDKAKQDRQMQRQNHKHILSIQSPSKERLAVDYQRSGSKKGAFEKKPIGIDFETSSRKSKKFMKRASKTTNQMSNDLLEPYKQRANDFGQNSTLRSNVVASTLPASMKKPQNDANYGGSTTNNAAVKKLLQKQGSVNQSLNYLQQVFHQRKQEEINGLGGSKFQLKDKSRSRMISLEPQNRTMSNLSKNKSMSLSKNPPTIDMFNSRASGVGGGAMDHHKRGMSHGRNLSPLQMKKMARKRSRSPEKSSSPARDDSPLSKIAEKEMSKPSTPLNQWAEEQRANVQQTYLRPFKLMQNGEVIQKPLQKGIKNGRAFGLPLVGKFKDTSNHHEPILGFGNQSKTRRNSNFTTVKNQHEREKLFSNHRPNQSPYIPATAVNRVDDDQEEIEKSRESPQIINLKMTSLNLNDTDPNNPIVSRKSSGEMRYQVELQPEIVGFQDVNMNDTSMTQDQFAQTADQRLDLNKILRKHSNDILHANKTKQASSHIRTKDFGTLNSMQQQKPSTLYPSIYAQQQSTSSKRLKQQMPWATRGTKLETSHQNLQIQKTISFTAGGPELQQAGSDFVSQGGQTTSVVRHPFKKSHSLTRPQMQHGGGMSNLATPVKSFGNSRASPSNKLVSGTLTSKMRDTGKPILPLSLQTTAAFSPDFPSIGKRDTRPTFLGGQYTSKVQGRSEVGQYISGGGLGRERNTIEIQTMEKEGVEQLDQTYDVASYYKQKLRMRNSLERVFASQVQQYHHGYKDKRNEKGRNYRTLQPEGGIDQERGQADIEFPQIQGYQNEINDRTTPLMKESIEVQEDRIDSVQV